MWLYFKKGFKEKWIVKNQSMVFFHAKSGYIYYTIGLYKEDVVYRLLHKD